MTTDEFDARLARAVAPLVIEPIAPEIAREAAGYRPSASRAMREVALAGTLVVLVAVAVAASHLPELRSTAGGNALLPSVVTSDGRVSAQRVGDRVELVLDRDGQAPLVLASLVEAQPDPNDSFISVHVADCPPATGLTQRYYAFGQVTHSSGAVAITGATGVGSEANDLYVIALTSDPAANDWSFRIGDGNGGGGRPGWYDALTLSGEQSPAGCLVGA